jgi:hypothetical protein
MKPTSPGPDGYWQYIIDSILGKTTRPPKKKPLPHNIGIGIQKMTSPTGRIFKMST